ncbi:MAG: asparagine--tRNA ligase [Myxococcota bacterium]|nr:asparagine--tRNA ligase [Myxococcota bacterium]MDW8361157.1 asparagine--tRNA ligase [Myxococcales bacterium]
MTVPRVRIESLERHVGQRVEIAGWLQHARSSKHVHFLYVRDGSGVVQVVVAASDVPPALFDQAGGLPLETSLVVRGTVRRHPRRDELELGLDELDVVSRPVREYPISPKEHGVDFLMDHRHLWLRSRRQQAILRVRAEIVSAIREYFDSRGFVLVDAPILTPNACEGTSTLFETDYHGQKAYLTQSGQLYAEAAAMAFGRTYCFGPTFRAEKSKTRRHLAEFWMVEPEVAFMDLEGDIALAEDFLTNLVARVLDRRRAELGVLERDVAPLERIRPPFVRLRYEQALEILREAGQPVRFGDDLGGDEETVLSQRFDRPVVVTHYPMSLKAFYFKRDPSDPSRALNMDVLAPEGYGEVIGGGQREDDLAALEAAIEAHRLPRAAFEWYLDLRRYGSVPHAGFGLGVERTVAWICGLHHVRETIPFPRMLHRLAP